MIRWILVCLLLAALAVAIVWAMTPAPPPVPKPLMPPITPHQSVQSDLLEYGKPYQPANAKTIHIPDAILVIINQQEVSSEKEGILLFVGTDVQPGEIVPPENQLPGAELGFLAIAVGPDDRPRDGETFFQLPNDSQTTYRRVRPTDTLEPNKVVLAHERRKVRKLQVGDRVRRGQLLALVNPRKQLDDVAMKVAKLNALEFERAAAEAQEKEFDRRYRNQLDSNRRTPGAIPTDTLMETHLLCVKYQFEKLVKAAEIVSAQRALSAAWTDLKMHEIHAAIEGVIKVIYKHHQGEAVKPLEAVLQIQDPSRLRVEGRLELQEARKLRKGMQVLVEASRPEHPIQVLSGHLQPVNGVAVSKGKRPVIVSGSDDNTLRGWDAATGEKLWVLKDMKSAVRAVACMPPGSQRNLTVFGMADGTVRLLDLDNLAAKSRPMAEHHQGAVNAVAFSPDGEVCASGSDDRTICLWQTETGKLLHRLPPLHRSAVTSLQFASASRLVSAARDSRLMVWDVEADTAPHEVGPELVGRGGAVSQLGVSPDGRTVLFDQGKEIRLLSLTDKQIEGSLQNPAEAMNFVTLALFAPDGKTVLTNGSAPGTLQLWRRPTDQGRGSELRQLIWMNGTATCAAFAPEDGSFVVIGTQDHQVLVWAMPSREEVESRLTAHLTLVARDLETQSRHVRVWAELEAPVWLFPGTRATMVIPLPPTR